MSGVNTQTPGLQSPNPVGVEQAMQAARMAALQGTAAAPKPALQAHHQILAFLREQKNGGQPTGGEVLKDNLNDFVEEHNKSRRKAKHVPKLSIIKETDIEHIQNLLKQHDTKALHQFMRKKRWSTVTLVIGDEVVTLSRPKNKKADLQYVNSHMDSAQAQPEDGQLLDLDADAIDILAKRLFQFSAIAMANGTGVPAAAAANAAAGTPDGKTEAEEQKPNGSPQDGAQSQPRTDRVFYEDETLKIEEIPK